MHVCFVSRRYWPAVSGMSVYAENLLRELVALGHRVTLVSQYRADPAGTKVYGGGEPPADRVPAGVRVVARESVGEGLATSGPDGRADFERDVTDLVAIVERLHADDPFDVLHAQFGWPPGLAVLEASRRLGLPNLVSVQGGDGHWFGLCCDGHAATIRRVFDSAQRLLIGCDSFRDEVVGHHGTALSQFSVVGGATDVDAFTPRSDRPLGDLADPPVLLFHGRVDARKGVLDLVDALDLLDRPVRLLVSGIGPELDVLRQRVAGRGDVELLGYVHHDDAPDVYRRGDVFVSPTYTEGFSNTVLEAMASGLPVVSTDTTGVKDAVRHLDNGLLHEPGDVRGLAEQLTRVLDDDVLRGRVAGTALEEVRRRYAWPVLARTVTALYDQVVGTAPLAGVRQDLSDVPAPDPDCRYLVSPHLL